MNLIYTIFTLFFINQIDTPNLLITYNGEKVESINKQEYFIPFVNEPFINYDKYKELEDYIMEQVYEEPRNASIDHRGKIVPSEIGLTLDHTSFHEQLFTSLLGNGPIVLDVPTIKIQPKVDTELLSTIRTNQIGHYMTYFNPRNKERSHNIALAMEAINNHVVFPGETFSFNKVVGKRTKEKGYLPAPVIVRGELSEGIGGGICQVSSTLFNAVDRAGVKIGKRYSHSKSVRYVPPGRDATVSWYGPDFTFTNEYNRPILIRAKIFEGKVLIHIYSSDDINFKPREVKD